MLETAAAGLTHCSRDLRYVSANPSYARLAGLPLDQIIGRPIVEVMGKAGFEVIRPHVERALRGERVQYEAEVPFAAAGPKFLHVVYTPDQDRDGNVVGWIASVTDITDRKQAEEALRHSELSNRSLFENMLDGFAYCQMIFDEQGHPEDFVYLEVNEAFGRLTGLGDVVGKRVTEVVPGIRESDPELLEAYGRVSVTGRPERFEFEFKPLDAWFSVSVYSPARGYFVAVFDNITQRRRAEEALRQSEELLRGLTDNSTDAIYVKDCESRWLFANPALLRIVSKSAQEVLGRTDAEIYADPAIGQAIVQNDRRVLETGEALAFEETARTPDGLRVFLSTKAPRRDAQGRITGLVGISRDITDRKAMQEALETAKATAEAANATKDHFLAVLSHELRTPLAPVLMTASALETDRGVPEWLRDDMAMIKRSVDLEVRLIDDLLDLNRISRGKLELRTERIDAHARILSAVEICRFDSAEMRLTVEIDLKAKSHYVNADGGRLQQIFWNLLKNAIKFTPQGGDIRVRSSNPDPATLRVEVSDTGRGIAPEMLSKLFDAFEQGGKHVTRQFGGMGLGLAISKALIEMHGGRIGAASDGPGKGATFTVELPIASSPETTGPAVAAAPGAKRKLRILVVEDNATTLNVFERFLKKAGHDVQVAASMREGLTLAGQLDGLDLLISDLGLPDGDGLALMRQIRASRPDVPGIALSGYGMEQDLQRSKEAGFAEHLTKPVELRALWAAIERVVTARP